MIAQKKPFERLTAQEQKVLSLVAEARSNKEIARALGVSSSTVKRHVENILRKLRLRNRVAAAVYAVTTADRPLYKGRKEQRPPEWAGWPIDTATEEV